MPATSIWDLIQGLKVLSIMWKVSSQTCKTATMHTSLVSSSLVAGTNQSQTKTTRVRPIQFTLIISAVCKSDRKCIYRPAAQPHQLVFLLFPYRKLISNKSHIVMRSTFYHRFLIFWDDSFPIIRITS